MRGFTGIWRSARAAALLAVALLTLAGVRSQVMQAAMSATAAPACGMPGMAMAGRSRHDDPASSPRKAPKVCDFCFASAHAPPQVDVARPLAPTTSVVVPAYAAWRTLGPRGPPAVPPKARGPPSLILTA